MNLFLILHMKIPVPFRALSIACAASLIGFLGFHAPAFASLSVSKGEAAGSVRVIVTNPSGAACGAEVNFGDGKTDRKRLEPKEQWQLQHAFGADGNFTVSVTGVPVIRGIRTVGACELQQQVAISVAGGQATAAAGPAAGSAPAAAAPAQGAAQPPAAQAQSAPQASPGESADLVLFYRKSSNQLRFVTGIDGARRLDSADRLASNGYQLCYVLFPDAYRGLGGPEAQRVLDGEVSRVMNTLAGNRQIRSNSVECIRGGQFVGASYADVVAVQRRVVPNLSAVREFQQGFEQFAEVKYETLAQVVARRQQAVAQRTQDVATWTAEIDTLAASGSTDKVGSITLSFPQGERESIRACTLEYSGAQGQAVIAYGNALLSYLSPAYRTRASEARATFNANQPYASGVYKSIDDFYVDLQKDPRKCNVFVDFPKNLKTVLTALARDRKDASFEVNTLVSTVDLREAWAKRQGFDSLAASEFASQIRANAATLKSLSDKGIRDKAGYDRVTDEMRSTKYSDSTSASDVLAYLEDKAAAAEKRGATAVSIRDERIRAQRAEAERRAQEEQRRRAEYAKEFPYTATISCGMNDRHINIMACMSGRGSLKSELELSNGSQYKMYQAWEVTQAGRETTEGMVIPLRSNFKLKIQNVDDTLILSVKIVSNANNRVVFNKSASRFGVILIEN